MIGNRMVYAAQLIGTLGILAFVPTNLGKLAAFLVWWAITFRTISKPELVMVAVACVFFTAMNALTLQQGIFAFAHPDILLMPYYELVMWGFYLLNTRRMVNGPAPESRMWQVWALAIIYAAAFGAIPDQQVLFGVTAVLLAVGLALFHEPRDLAYVGYMVLMGGAIEYTGVWSGQWGYPGDPIGGVPPWFITLWGGVGLFLRRLVLPYVVRFEHARRERHGADDRGL